MEKVIDCMGMACPLPVINAKKAIEAFTEDGILCVKVDNDTAVQNLQRLASHKGAECSVEQKGAAEFEVRMQVKAAGVSPAAGPAPAGSAAGEVLAAGEQICVPAGRPGGTVVVLSSNAMGTGDEKLGKKLMNGFLFALTSQDTLPEKVICYNTGAYLTTEVPEAVEDLKKLEAAGVTVMTCGTCLDFYGLKEKLQVGIISNMYDIVEAQMQASLIIRP